MKTIESFLVDHEKLLPGLYVSRRDGDGQITTFDLRFTAPNREEPMNMSAVHTIEHIGATFLRNSARADEVVYFGPMGCRTGFYLVMLGRLDPVDVYELVTAMCAYIASFCGEIPGATPKECGNYSDQNLPLANKYAAKYLRELQEKRFSYPGQ